MVRAFIIAVMSMFVLANCTPEGTQGKDGVVTRLTEKDAPAIQFRQLDTINAIRQAKGMQPLALSAQLTAAANTHALDMSRQNRPWHFGSDGSSPVDRIARAGFAGLLVGENISESYEDDLTTLKAWLQNPNARLSIEDPDAAYLGVGWFQESNGKMWWVQVIGK
jgi:uncharacterized protein YkwD